VYALKFSLNDQYKEMLLARRRSLAEGTGLDGTLTVLDRIAAGESKFRQPPLARAPPTLPSRHSPLWAASRRSGRPPAA
jgi:hypothetical protein